MSLKDCMDSAVAGGEMDPGRASEAKRLFDEVEREYLDALGPEGAALRAAQETVDRLKAEALETRRQRLIAIRTQRRIAADIAHLPDVREAALALVDGTGVSARSPSAEQVRKKTVGLAHGMIADLLATFRRDIAGRTRNQPVLLDVVREAFGEETGNQVAKDMAKSWFEASEFLRNRFNAGGGHIGRLERWGLPQSHDTLKVRQSIYKDWRDFILPKLDMKRTVDGVSGKPFTREQLELALRDVHETLRTDGFSKVNPSSGGGGALANRRADPRFLHFKSADDWLAYQDRFGTADAWSAMMAHIDHMGRDIGAMTALGPNPMATIRWLQQTMKKSANETVPAVTGRQGAQQIDGEVETANRAAAALEATYMHYSGAVNQPVNGPVARFFQGTRQILTSAMLGSAAITAISDTNFIRIAAKHAGLSPAKALNRYVKLLAPGSIEDQKLAVRLGLIAENWSQVASAQMRYVGEITGPEWTRRLSDAVLRASYLSHMTQAGRWAFGMEFMGALADFAGKRFDELPKPLRSTLERYQIGEDAWNIIRATDVYEHRGATFIRPDDIIGRDGIAPEVADDIATRMLSMIQTETEFAVPSVSLRGKAVFAGKTQPGTISGEIIRSGLMFKNFAITLYFTHIRRALDQKGALAKSGYFANLVIGSALMGALSMQLKEISKGKDPRPMGGDNQAQFWMAALLQGGGLGIFGDFLFSDVNRFGGGLSQTIAGPVVAFGNDLQKLTLGNAQELASGKKTNAGRELAHFARRYTPGASLWYARLALDRLIFDQIEQAVDPDARKLVRRAEKRQERKFGNQFFWRRGEATPDRAPDISSAIGGGS